MKLLSSYQNGNYTVTIYDDGTKVREGDVEVFAPAFPECIDIKITNYCDLGCPYCHEDSTTSGKHADFSGMPYEVINSLAPYTELAIGGGNPLAHPELVEFLLACQKRNIICNLTVNQAHLEEQLELLLNLTQSRLIYGLGVSVSKPTLHIIQLIKKFPNAVVHTIAGITTISDYEMMAGNNLKVLILGYKTFRRGVTYSLSHDVTTNIAQLAEQWPKLYKHFDVISFDNLALKQLKVKDALSEQAWNEFYMGDDGGFTMYIDLVERKFARNSISTNRHDLMPNIRDMFAVVNKE